MEDRISKRTAYKEAKRFKMQCSLDFDYQAWQIRVERWREHLRHIEYRKQVLEHDKKA